MAMYLKDLTEELKVRISKDDMIFLKTLAEKRSIGLSELVRSMVGEYRRSLEMVDAMNKMLALTKEDIYDISDKLKKE